VARTKRKQIDLNNESLKSLLQEIYNQSCEERTNAIRLRNRIEKDMKGNVDIQIVSKALGDSNKLVQDSLQKKILVAKMIAECIGKGEVNSGKDKQVVPIQSTSPQDLRKMIKEAQNNKNK